MALNDNCQIMKEIAKTEEALKSTYARVDLLEKQLYDKDLPESKQKEIKTELDEVRKLLATNEEQLAHLRTHNRKSFVFVASIMFIFFTFYVMYVLMFGTDNV
ncbi:unnamed protein product [Brassicogethes aeneus]|uniref:Coiled-coil domain-containing protein 167 n=1 Tax=Brassicogethes aeneus TaxID=1431903 RepID=A0A9P0FCC0_BRAAE|nr:unnamed protein product [Brassicogethes aeneus]